jgi:hypothetical protein
LKSHNLHQAKYIITMTYFKIVFLVSYLAAASAQMQKCDFAQDCDDDSDCAAGLICADDHKKTLIAAGFDERRANCGDVGVVNLKWEACFDPSILSPPTGGGFGGKIFFL